MELTISTPERVAFSGAADSVVVNADKGQLTILPQHANLITFVEEGPLKVKASGGETEFLFFASESIATSPIPSVAFSEFE